MYTKPRVLLILLLTVQPQNLVAAESTGNTYKTTVAYGFNKVDAYSAEYEVAKDKKGIREEDFVSEDDIPPIRSLDGIGMCKDFSGAMLLDMQTCIKENIKPCKSLPRDKQVSTFDLSRFNRFLNTGDRRSRKSYAGHYNDGNPGLIVENAVAAGSVASEDCFSFDKRVAEVHSREEADTTKRLVWQKLHNEYTQNQLEYEKYDSNADCNDCGSSFFATAKPQIEENFNLKVNNVGELKALGKASYEEFLDQFLTPKANDLDCSYKTNKMLSFDSNLTVEYFPEKSISNDSEKPSLKDSEKAYSEAIRNLRIAFHQNSLVSVSNFCADPGEAEKLNLKDCNAKHSFVLAGYKKICKKNNSNDCKEIVRVLNSWGEDWQTGNNNGWMDAKELLNRTKYAKQNFAWVRNPKPENTDLSYERR